MVLALILISSFVMTLEDVWYTTKPMLMDVLYYLDKILTVVFFLETCLKLVAMGIVAYFGNAWCWLDFIIVGVSIVNFGASVIGKIFIGIIKPSYSFDLCRSWEYFHIQDNEDIEGSEASESHG